MTQIFFLSKKYIKNAEFHADFKSIEKLVKKCTKKVISKTGLTDKSESEKSAYFCQVFSKSFFLVHFSKLFKWS
jgi:hypothetical protein